MRSDMNLEETNDVTAATQDVLAHHLEFIVKNGKIVTQTFAGKMSPKN
jgi:hypothetical protein